MKRRVVDSGEIVVRVVPYADEMREISHSISLDARSGKYGNVETAGLQAMAVLLQMYADGQLGTREGYALLSRLADRKTSDPVQRMEVDQRVDMRVLIGGILEQSQEALSRMMELARERREEVRRRLGESAAELELRVVGGNTERVVYGEPEEVRRLRDVLPDG
jgi:hypothetical protein